MKSSFAIRVFIAYLFAVLAQTPVAAQSLSNLTGEVTGTGHIDSRWQVELRAVNESRASPPERAYLQPDAAFSFRKCVPAPMRSRSLGRTRIR